MDADDLSVNSVTAAAVKAEGVSTCSAVLSESIQCFQLRVATQWFLNIVYIIRCKKIIMQALVMQFGNDVGTSFLFVYADFGEYSLLRAVVNGL